MEVRMKLFIIIAAAVLFSGCGSESESKQGSDSTFSLHVKSDFDLTSAQYAVSSEGGVLSSSSSESGVVKFIPLNDDKAIYQLELFKSGKSFTVPFIKDSNEIYFSFSSIVAGGYYTYLKNTIGDSKYAFDVASSLFNEWGISNSFNYPKSNSQLSLEDEKIILLNKGLKKIGEGKQYYIFDLYEDAKINGRMDGLHIDYLSEETFSYNLPIEIVKILVSDDSGSAYTLDDLKDWIIILNSQSDITSTIEAEKITFTSPLITEFSVENGATVSGNLTLAFLVSDTYGISGVSAYVNGSALELIIIDGRYHITIDTEAFNDGAIEFEIVASNVIGESNEHFTSYDVNNNGVSINLISPSDGSSVSGVVDFKARVISGSDIVSYSLGSYQPYLVGNMTLYECTTDFTTEIELQDGIYSVSVNTAQYEDSASKNFCLKFNAENGSSSKKVFTLGLDNTAPICDFSVQEYMLGVVNVASTVTDLNPSSVEWKLGNDLLSSQDVLSFDTATYSDGNNTLTLTATDESGNSSVKTKSFYIDNEAPSLEITSPMMNAALGSSYVLTWDAFDSSATGERANLLSCEIKENENYINSNIQCALGQISVSTGNLTGPVTLKITATDPAGRKTVKTLDVIYP